MTDADARAREIAERIVADWHGDDPPHMSGVYDDLVALIASALSTSAGYRAGVEDAAKVVREEWHEAVNRFALGPGTQIEATIGVIIERLCTLAPPAEVKPETTAEERAQYRSYGVGFPSQESFATRMVRDFDRLLASHKGEREDGA